MVQSSISNRNRCRCHTIAQRKGWVQLSLLGASTRKLVDIFDKPNGKSIVKLEVETQVAIEDIKINWVKINHNGLIGWVEAIWLCGNPVTTCP